MEKMLIEIMLIHYKDRLVNISGWGPNDKNINGNKCSKHKGNNAEKP